LLPITAAIDLFLPEISTYTEYITDFFDIVMTYIGFVLSLVGINATIIAMVVGYWTFKLTVPAIAWLIKLVLKWWHTIKP